MSMFCYQCEQAAKGGCAKIGVCGKQPDVSNLQDLTVWVLRGLSLTALEARKAGIATRQADELTVKGLFSTLTNVNFDPQYFEDLVREIIAVRDGLKNQLGLGEGLADRIKDGLTKLTGGQQAVVEKMFAKGPAAYVPPADRAAMVGQGERHAGLKAYPTDNEDIASLMHTVLFGIRGIAAYADHAQILGQRDEALYSFLHEALAAGWDGQKRGLEDWVGLALKVGEFNLKAMELLDRGNTETYGHPTPTAVPLGHRRGKCVLVSGHDLKDLHQLLQQTDGQGIDVYTHGEMLPCHGYPELKKYQHFIGHYGTAWQNQKKEFAEFPGPIVMTTNCIQEPQGSYKQNIFATGLVGWPGVPFIAAGANGEKDFTAVIRRAKEMPGFTDDQDRGSVMVGFARNAVLGVADKVIEAVQSGAIRHFFLVAGCDGAKPGRNYYTEFVEKAPQDTVILTLACGKFRFFDKNLGTIGGLPRLLDIGQCNDAYSAIQIAVALSQAFKVGVNELPLSLVLSWYEQKAVAILLTLLYLGIKNIRLGPTLPAFLTPNVIDFLVQNYDIKPITTPEADLKAILG